jgi:GcrA cell cycle regulator
MQSFSWTPDHSDALRQHLAMGLSYSESAEAINAKFGTDYTRSAALGRAKRMGVAGPKRRTDPARAKAPRLRKQGKPGKSRKLREGRTGEVQKPTAPPLEREPVKLRCVGITPRLLSFADLAPGDCRYPYGGDREGEAITFCGHSQLAGSSYCPPHFQLTRGPGTASERAAGPVVLRLVEAA